MNAHSKTDVPDALHEFGDTAKHAAADLADSTGTVVTAAVASGREALRTASSNLSDKAEQARDAATEKAGQARDAATEKAGQARDAATDKASDLRSLAADKATDTRKDLRRRGRRAAKKADAARQDALDKLEKSRRDAMARAEQSRKDAAKQAKKSRRNAGKKAAGLLDDARNALPMGASGAKAKAKKGGKGRTLAKGAAIAALVAGVVAIVRALRPNKTSSTGSSVPPKIVRPTPVPSDDAVGGVSASGKDASPSVNTPGADPASTPVKDDDAGTPEVSAVSDSDNRDVQDETALDMPAHSLPIDDGATDTADSPK